MSPTEVDQIHVDRRKVELFKDQVLLWSSVLVPSSVSFCLSLSLTDTHTVEQGKILDVKQQDPNKHSKWVSCRDTHVCNSWTHFVIVTVWWLIMPALGCHVYLWRRRHPRLAQIHVYTVAHGLDVSLQLVLSRHHDILDSTPQRWRTHILSDNHYHLMCICEEIATQKSLKFTLIHTVSIFDCFNTAFVLSTSVESFNHKVTAYLCPLHVLVVIHCTP